MTVGAARRGVLPLVALTAAGALLVAGCGSSESAGAASSTTVAVGPLWNPCTEIPDEAIAAAGLDPASETPDVAGVKTTGWEVCSWKAPWYYFGVFSSGNSLEEVRNNPKFENFRPVTINGREGLMYLKVADREYHEECDIAFASPQGSVMLTVGANPSKGAAEDPCVVVTRHATELEQYLPGVK